MDRRHFAMLAGGAALGAAATGCARRGQASLPAEPAGAADGAPFRTQMRYSATRFGRIAYLERGTGEAALFLHGFPLSSYQWRGAIARLAPYRRCIAPDFLGLGYTEVAGGQGVDPASQCEMLAALLDRLGVERVDLVASDSGGAVAQLFLVRYPARVRTLMLTNCDTEIDSPPPAVLPLVALARAGRFADEWLGRWLVDKRLARSAEGIGGMCYTDPSHPTDDAIEAYFTPLVSSPRRKELCHDYLIALEANPLVGVEATLRRSTVPARFVWGAADDIFSRESPAYLARTFGASRGVRLLQGRKLFFPEELPDIIAEEARALWMADAGQRS